MWISSNKRLRLCIKRSYDKSIINPYTCIEALKYTELYTNNLSFLYFINKILINCTLALNSDINISV